MINATTNPLLAALCAAVFLNACGGGDPAAIEPLALFIDINKVTQAELQAIPTLNAENASFIVREREAGGSYKDLDDLAGRTCPAVAVNMEETSIQVGASQVVYRGTDSGKSWGMKCALNDGTYTVDNKKHNYVGHVTLLR